MFEELNAHRQAVANNIKKAFDEDIEKAHQDGDIHPKHPDWVWVSSAAGGKGDWRKFGGRAHQKHQASQGGSGSQVPSGGKSVKTDTTKKPAKFVPKQTFKNAYDMANKMNMHLEKNIDIQQFVDILGKTVYDKGVGTKYRNIRAGSGSYEKWDCSTSSYLQKDSSGDYLEFKDKPSQEKLDKCAKLLKDQLAKKGYDVNPKFTVLSHNPYYQHNNTFGVGISIKITKKEVQSSSKTK